MKQDQHALEGVLRRVLSGGVCGIGQAEEANVSALCRRFGVSRRTGYKWLGRYAIAGVSELLDRSRRPRSSPERTSEVIEGRVLSVRKHHRRMAILFNATDYPAVEWKAQQIVEAFPFNEAPRFLLRDRDSIYGQFFRQRIKHMGVEQVVTAYRSPWQSPYVERIIGSILRECLNHVIVLNEVHLRRILASYFEYYHESRAHLSLDRNVPMPRRVDHPSEGEVIAMPQVGGLHHRYRRAA